MILDPATVALTFAAVFLISFTKGAFGGGFAILGIPLMALVVDPIVAGAMLAPLFCLGDLFAARYWKPSTWSKPDLAVLIPGLLIGTGLGYVAIKVADRHLIAITIALITLVFTGLWFKGGGTVTVRPRSTAKGAVAGLFSGMGSMIAHAGGPPVAMYLLPLGLPKAVYAGTTFMYFVVGNLAKVGPWLWVAQPTPDMWLLMAMAAPAVPLGAWIGWRLHERLNQVQMYRACYALLAVVALKLLWDGVSGYLN